MPETKKNRVIFWPMSLLVNLRYALVLTLCCAACSNQELYETIQQNRQQECLKLPQSQVQECLREAEESFEDYQRAREEGLEK